MIMQGFVGFRIPIIVRRLVTMIPAFIVVWLGVNSTNALVISQVVLSIALPAPVIALLIFTRRKDIMGAFANSRLTNVAAVVGDRPDPHAERNPADANVRREHSGIAERLTGSDAGVRSPPTPLPNGRLRRGTWRPSGANSRAAGASLTISREAQAQPDASRQFTLSPSGSP